MKPQRFHPGQPVAVRNYGLEDVYTNIDTGHSYTINNLPSHVPHPNEVVTIDEYIEFNEICGEWLVMLKEYPTHSFTEDCFEPLVDSSVIEAELEEIFYVQPAEI